ncbi:hypothetical protein AAVH_38105 [Aphelenchoides avenae]|nr:hypothetical protein AAVH_38105 [Aphelenchus avenae]
MSTHREHDLTLGVSDSVPCVRATFAVDDDGILQFLCSGEGNYERKLEICHTNATEQLPLRLESAFAAIQGEPQVKLTLVPRHPNHERVIEATNRFTRALAGPQDEVLYTNDESTMSFWMIHTFITPSLGVTLHPTNE